MKESDIRNTLSEIESELSSGVSSAELLNDAGVGYYLLGEMKQALDFLKMAAQKKDSPDIQFNLANTYSALGKPHKAIDTFLKVLEAYPGHIGALNNLADEYESIGELDKAHELFHYLTQLQPNAALSHFNLGNFFLRQNQHIEAAKCYERALENDEMFVDAYYNIAWILFKSKAFDDALRYIKNGLFVESENTDLINLKQKVIDSQEETAG